MRGLLPALAMTVLPACGENKIWVQNAGTSDALVHVRYYTQHGDSLGYSWSERHDDTWIVGPGQAGEEDYPSSALKVRITALPGGAVLFEDVVDHEDFRDEHSRIELTVYP